VRHILVFISITAVLLCCSCGGTSSSVREEIVTAPSIIITPSSATVAAGGVQQFVASVRGIANTAVLWSIQEGAAGGTIDANGKYTAPMTSGTYHLIAQSQANPSVSASATITVSTPGEAQGVYAGTYSWNQAFYAIVLPDDMFYSIEGSVAADGSMSHVYRLVSGPGKSNSGKYTAGLTAFLAENVSFGLTLNATYVPATSLTGTMTPPATSELTATLLPVSQFDFNSPANLSHISGSWTGIPLQEMLTGQPVIGTVEISSIGEITLITSVPTGCSYSGTVTPDSKKNFFKVTITFGPAPCEPPNQTISGLAIEMLLTNGATRQLLIVMRQSTVGFAALR
jgi:hypothetical protein